MPDQPTPAAPHTAYDYLVIGGGMVADAAARGIRELDAEGSIGILAAEQDPPATRPALSKKLWTDPGFPFEDIWMGTEPDTGAVRYPGTAAVALDPEARTVTADDGRTFGYGTALLATGGTPRGLPAAGGSGPDADAAGAEIDFRTVQDYRRLRKRCGDDRSVTVVGGGFIGTELAAALVQNETVTTLVFPQEVLGGSVFPPRLAQRFHDSYARAGVHLHPGARVQQARTVPGGVELTLSDGTSLSAPTVVVGVGIEPNDGLARRAGITVDDGVSVDDRLRTSAPHVYAAGDVARYPDAICGRRRVEHVDNAEHMGRQAGRNMAGADEPYAYTPYFYSQVFGTRYEALGSLDASLRTVEDWSEAGDTGVVYYVDEAATPHPVVGVLLWNVDDRWDASAARDAARRTISEARSADPRALRGSVALPA